MRRTRKGALMAMTTSLALAGCIGTIVLPGTGSTPSEAPTAPPTVEPSATPSESKATPVPRLSVSASDLTGDWQFGDAGNPPSAPVIRCAEPAWTLKQQGAELTAERDTSFIPSGAMVVKLTPSLFVEYVRGTNENGVLRLAGGIRYRGSSDGSDLETVTYELTFDPATQRLTGTRNGQAVWAVPVFRKPVTGRNGMFPTCD